MNACRERYRGPWQRSEADEGFTLIELAVAMLIMAVILALLTPTYSALVSNSTAADNLTGLDTGIRPVLAQMEADFSSAGTVCVSAGQGKAVPDCQNTSSSASGFDAVLYLYPPGSGMYQPGTGTCVEWGLIAGKLERRSWPPSSVGGSGPGHVGFTDETPTLTFTNTTQAPFSTSGAGGEFVSIVLWGRVSSPSNATPTEVQAGVNAQGNETLASQNLECVYPTNLS